jgi:hypothetical protein
MPSTSKKQHNFMEAIAHSPSFAKKAGVPQSVGQDFSAADKGRKFAKGGDTMATKGMNLFKGKETYKEELAEGKAIKSGKISPQQYAKGEESEKTKKMAMGGPTGKADPRMAAMLAAKMRGGAPARPAARPSVDPRMAAALMAARRGGPSAPPPADMPMKKGGMAKFAAGGFVRAADGIAQKGKTKAKQIKMAGGGKC